MAGNITDCLLNKCVTADGFSRGFLSINFQLPGPTIHVCKNDIVVVDVGNEAEGIGTSIHWHGMRQFGSQFSDGVPYLTQCPISYFTRYRYIFTAADPGTHFYHSHSANQKADGINGALIVREYKNDNPNLKLYDFDLPQHLIMTADWMHEFSDNFLPGAAKRSALTDSMLINGRGRYLKVNNEYTASPVSIFYVQSGKRYRFRLINSATNVCAYQFQIESHNFTIIGTELSHAVPITVDTLHYLSGERYDIVVEATQPFRDYWIRVRELEPCWKNTEAFAVLRYQEDEVDATQPNIEFVGNDPPNWNASYPITKLFNSLQPKVKDTALFELQSYEEDRTLLTTKPDYSFHLFIDSPGITNNVIYMKNNLKDYTCEEINEIVY
jgi:FtsP/CotA-like multicopper oxidase with cupredoxin domain